MRGFDYTRSQCPARSSVLTTTVNVLCSTVFAQIRSLGGFHFAACYSSAQSQPETLRGLSQHRCPTAHKVTSPGQKGLRLGNRAPVIPLQVDPSVCAIARCGAGVNNVPVDELTKRSVSDAVVQISVSFVNYLP